MLKQVYVQHYNIFQTLYAFFLALNFSSKSLYSSSLNRGRLGSDSLLSGAFMVSVLPSPWREKKDDQKYDTSEASMLVLSTCD